LARDPDGAEVEPADRAMLDVVLKLTRQPGTMRESDLVPLRAHGFDDAAMLDIVQVTAYYNYVNRMADGLGVELEPYWTPDDLTMTREEFEAGRHGRAGDAP
jgi:uncharacterized peroxidase-related enzyme